MQLALPLAVKQDYINSDSFIELPENATARDFLYNFFEKNSNITDFKAAPFANVILQGPKCCGKTHLLNILAHEFGAYFLSLDQANDLDLLAKLPPRRIYIVEDVDRLEDDEILQHLINFALEAELFLVMSLSSLAKFSLWDLVSRLKAIPLTAIEDNISQQSLHYFLVGILINRQINLATSKIDFLVKNCQRDYASIIALIDKIEEFDKQFLKQPNLAELKKMI